MNCSTISCASNSHILSFIICSSSWCERWSGHSLLTTVFFVKLSTDKLQEFVACLCYGDIINNFIILVRPISTYRSSECCCATRCKITSHSTRWITEICIRRYNQSHRINCNIGCSSVCYDNLCDVITDGSC